jgi:hypothetical protein
MIVTPALAPSGTKSISRQPVKGSDGDDDT